MCGIAGIVDWRKEPDRETVAAMVATMPHRGPDHCAVVGFGHAVLGHLRLAIIDLDAASNQPMSRQALGLSIVFNGEIYNFPDLRRELEGEGARFSTHGDTEVLLHAYARWGTDCFRRLNGMFALAIWDQTQRRLVLARDRLGKKPLFLKRLPGGIAFASELKALRRHPALAGAQIRPAALSQFLAHGYVLGDQCILDGVEKLPPAHFAVLEPGKELEVHRYWDLAARFREKRTFSDEKSAAEELRALIDDAVRIRLVGNVPLGAFLSGGIDSATIVAAMAHLHPADRTKTFSIGFRERGFSEVPQAEEVARILGVDHASRIVDADMGAALPFLARMADEPFADTSILPTYHLARFAREQVTVALSGDGGDELFAGYETYVATALHRRLSRFVPPAAARRLAAAAHALVPTCFGKVSLDYKLKQFLGGLALPLERAHASWREILSADERHNLLRGDRGQAVTIHDPFARFNALFAEVAGCHWLDRASYVDINTFLVDDVLVKVDRATMACSLEARAPLLDYRIVELAAALPPEWKLNGFSKKYLLRQSQRARLPQSVLARRKRGFNAPLAHWLTGGLRDLAYEATTSSAMLDWFERDAVERLWHDHRTRRRDNSYRLGVLAMLGFWMEESR
ncbi:asparagine synthase (glutamine-hydrolyzing) [Magnetospirillum moscoviense]|uniref:asparagine synthase (glutamine-hydrolyzing) n=1 Tax=Magnetospirillum moscoviense TaxID=1437059 RepID=A0A178MWE3_9PROT|nr:asparagine synthase (glutamine-hydrolyzing) [Magnetospirillum moscoviense]OAN55066.1 asparagine synthetase B [Magnetospirillum moscoviense]